MKNKKILIITSILAIAIAIGSYLIKTRKNIPGHSFDFGSPKTHTYMGIVYEGSYDRYNNIVKKAASLKNPDICDEIDFGQDHGDYTTPPGKSRYFCRADYAVETSDIEYCKSLDSEVVFAGTIIQKDKCIRDLAKKLNDKSLCEFLSDETYCPVE